MSENIVPVIIGSDIGAYAVARSFHEEYKVKSYTFGKGILPAVKNSSIVKSHIIDGFDDDEIFRKNLIDFAKKNKNKVLFLFSASEHYISRIFDNYDYLIKYYNIPYADVKLGKFLMQKENMYKLFQKYDIDYPRLITVNRENIENIPFDFPVVLKPGESTKYFDLSFEGKEKAYIIKNIDDLNLMLKKIYSSGYKNPMFIQEYIRGDINNEYVMNVYIDRHLNPSMMSLGKIVAQDPDPNMRGNYVAITDVEQDDKIKELFKKITRFLKEIKFTGLCNFDFKKDSLTNKIFCFEINLRQGRSSYFSTLSGSNYAKAVVNDYIFEREEFLKSDKEFLWYSTDYDTLTDILKVKNPEMLDFIKDKPNKSSTMEYEKDNSFSRKIIIDKYFKYYRNSIQKFL